MRQTQVGPQNANDLRSPRLTRRRPQRGQLTGAAVATSHPDFHRRPRSFTRFTGHWMRSGRGLSPPVRSCTDHGAREVSMSLRRPADGIRPWRERPSARDGHVITYAETVLRAELRGLPPVVPQRPTPCGSSRRGMPRDQGAQLVHRRCRILRAEDG